MKHRLSSRYRTAFVTGASAGLGASFVEMLLSEGVSVWGTSRDLSRLPVRDRFYPIALNLADLPVNIEAIYVAAELAAGGFDLVVNNAGYGIYEGFTDVSSATWINQIKSMLEVPLLFSHLALRGMRKAGKGALVNVSSLAVEFPLPFMSGYNVVKAGLSALSESLIIEAKTTGVIIIDFRPGDYRTDFNRSMQRPVDPNNEPAATEQDQFKARAWTILEKNLDAAPGPGKAAHDLRRALVKGRSGTVRSGGFFQTVVAPFLSRFASISFRRAALSRYFGTC